MDGDNGLGLVVGPWANEIAMDKAAQAGSGWVAVCNTNHYGIAGYYPLRALERDLIGWAMTNSSHRRGAALGRRADAGHEPDRHRLPGPRGAPIVIDMATSAVAYGKIEIARRRGQAHPEGLGHRPRRAMPPRTPRP